MMHYSLKSKPFHILFRILQDNDGATAALVVASIYTPPVFDDSGCSPAVFDADGCTDSVSATVCSATADLLDPYTAN